MSGKPFGVTDILRVFRSLDQEEKAKVRELLSIISINTAQLLNVIAVSISILPMKGKNRLLDYVLNGVQEYFDTAIGDTFDLFSLSIAIPSLLELFGQEESTFTRRDIIRFRRYIDQRVETIQGIINRGPGTRLKREFLVGKINGYNDSLNRFNELERN